MKEPLGLDDTPKNRRYAEGLRAEVVRSIALGSFDYAKYFPNSRQVDRSGSGAGLETIGDKLRAYLLGCAKAVRLGNMSAASLQSYRWVVHGKLIPDLGDIRLCDWTTAKAREWVSLLEGTRKTINNVLIPLRAVLDDAAGDQVIEFSPLARLPIDKILGKTAKQSEYVVQPFSAAEVGRILDKAGPDRALFQFAFFTGLRTSEYIALDWPAVDLNAGTVRIDKVRVANVDQPRTKTRAGTRTIDLMAPALAAIQAQRVVSQLAGRHVFLLNGSRWSGDKPVRLHWKRILKAAKVAYRNPYQTRHTFATMMLALGEVPLRVADLLGHVDTEMVNRHYGKWIGVDTATVRREWEALIAELSGKQEAKVA